MSGRDRFEQALHSADEFDRVLGSSYGIDPPDPREKSGETARPSPTDRDLDEIEDWARNVSGATVVRLVQALRDERDEHTRVAAELVRERTQNLADRETQIEAGWLWAKRNFPLEWIVKRVHIEGVIDAARAALSTQEPEA